MSDEKVIRTNLGDTATIKRILDDAVINVLLGDADSTSDYGFDEDTSMSNLKLFVGFSAVGSSLLSHVYPAPFPRNWWCLLACCAAYFALSSVLQLLLSFVELESILLLRGNASCKARSIAGLNVSSSFPRFQHLYTLGVTPIPTGRHLLPLAAAPKFRPDVDGGNTEPHCLQRSWSVEKYFDEEGIFALEAFEADVREFVAEHDRMLQADGAEGKKTK